MAHARIIRQTFYNDPLIADKYKLDERYLLIGLACVADDYGKFWYSPANIRSTIFPTDPDITIEWIEQCLQKFIDSRILCQYEADGILHGHFPKWFEKGWILKQKIDHPREFEHPDCPICMTETNKRESSRTIKANKKKSNSKEFSRKEVNVIKLLTDFDFYANMEEKYPLILKDKYMELLNKYDRWVKQRDAYDRDHHREFEGQLMGEQDKIERGIDWD